MKKKADSKKTQTKPARRKVFLSAALLGLILFVAILAAYFYTSSTKHPSPNQMAEVKATSNNLQIELAKCDQTQTEELKSACRSFIEQWCQTLTANYPLQQKATVAAQDLGLRLPVLEQPLDPFNHRDCYQQWWLTEGTFPSADVIDVQGNRYVVKPFSDFKGLTELSPQYFAHKDNKGDLQFPEKYAIEKKYSRHDQELLKRTLQVAYKYADVNVAIRDGYAPQPFFDEHMGIHFSNLALYDATINIDEPEFLTYVKSRRNNSYALAQLGYILVKNNNAKKFQYSLFQTHEAHGHNHFLACFYVDEHGWWKEITFTNDEPSGTKETIRILVGQADRKIPMRLSEAIAYYNNIKSKRHLSPYHIGCFDSIWMMHVAVNLYNENGLFADVFPLVDTMTKTGEIYSLFGRKFDINDYEFKK